MASGSNSQKDSGDYGQLSQQNVDMLVNKLMESRVECLLHRNGLDKSLIESCGHTHCSDCLDERLKEGRLVLCSNNIIIVMQIIIQHQIDISMFE